MEASQPTYRILRQLCRDLTPSLTPIQNLISVHMSWIEISPEYWRDEKFPLIVGDTNRLSCEPRGIPQKGLQIACVVTIYVNDIICKLA